MHDINCPCGRRIFLDEDVFALYREGFIGKCDCGRIWQLHEISGLDHFPEMTEEEEFEYSLETRGGKNFVTRR